MDKHAAAQHIIAHALPHVPFDGWTDKTLTRAAHEAGYSEADLIRTFPGGVMDAVNAWVEAADEAMEHEAERMGLTEMKIRERIAALIKWRLMHYSAHREAIRKALALYGLPWNAHQGLRTLYHTVDRMWRLSGDASTDYNWYTKRMLLAGVYSSTLLYWLEDTSEGHKATWEFLGRRIENVMSVGKLVSRMDLSSRRRPGSRTT